MSDLNIYELEDIIWDEFGQGDDHIVPYSRNENANGHASQVDCDKKPRFDVIGVSSNADDKFAPKCVAQKKEERDFSTVNIPNNTMLDKGPWSHTPDNMFSASYDNDPIKEVTSLASDNTRSISHCFKSNNIDSLGELCSDDPILCGRCPADVSNCYSYPLTQISQTENDLHLVDNTHEDESSDLLYYSWSDIGNFEDVDGMLRSCDSSLWLGSTRNEDEIGWFSASDAIEGSEDASKSNLKFSYPVSNALRSLSEDLELKNESFSVNDSNMESVCVSYKASSQLSEIDDPVSLSSLTFVNESNEISESKDNFILRDQKKQQRHKEGKRKDERFENGVSLRHINDLQKKGIHLPSGETSQKGCTSIGVQQQKQNFGPGYFDYLSNNVSYVQSDYYQPSGQTTVSSTLSGIKSENNAQIAFSQKDSSHASNSMLPMEHSHNLSFVVTDIAPEEMRGKLCHQQGFQLSSDSNSKHVDLISFCNPVSEQKGKEFENHSDIEGVSVGVLADLGGPSDVQESCSIDSGLNEFSLEATSFRQLQQVMEQLDSRTKLCIRDSLYRLARSAKQRHNYANLNGGPGDDKDANTFVAEGTKCSGYMDIETDTNPIDRSIAHLLFHRPSMSLKSHSMIPVSTTGSPMIIEKLCHEESDSETDRKVSGQ